MKSVTWFCLIVLSIGSVSGQVLLAPQATGHVGQLAWRSFYYSGGSLWVMYGPTMLNYLDFFSNGMYMSVSILNGVMEFNIDQTVSGNPFPTDQMTQSNWRARIVGLLVSDAHSPGDNFSVDLYDLEDYAENGLVNQHDRNAYSGYISQLFSTIPPSGTVLSPIDVTSELRRDLFGSGMGDETSGFYLRTDHDSGPYHSVRYNPSSVRIEVVISPTRTHTPTPGPTDTPTMTPIFSYTPTRTPTPTYTPTPTPTRPPTYTPTPSCTPRPTLTPTQTNTPVVAPVVRVWMPSQQFKPSMVSACFVYVMNPNLETLVNVPLVVALDVHGQFLFAPDFDDFSCYFVDLPHGESAVSIIEPFFWPENAGTADGIQWHAALIDATMTRLISDMDTFTFGWGE